MGLIVMVILIAMKKLKEHVDTKMKTEEKMVKKVLYKIIWLICTGVCPCHVISPTVT